MSKWWVLGSNPQTWWVQVNEEWCPEVILKSQRWMLASNPQTRWVRVNDEKKRSYHYFFLSFLFDPCVNKNVSASRNNSSLEGRVTAEDGDDASFSIALSLKHASCRTLKGGEKQVWFYCHVKVRAAIGIFFGAGVLEADDGAWSFSLDMDAMCHGYFTMHKPERSH